MNECDQHNVSVAYRLCVYMSISIHFDEEIWSPPGTNEYWESCRLTLLTYRLTVTTLSHFDKSHSAFIWPYFTRCFSLHELLTIWLAQSLNVPCAMMFSDVFITASVVDSEPPCVSNSCVDRETCFWGISTWQPDYTLIIINSPPNDQCWSHDVHIFR